MKKQNFFERVANSITQAAGSSTAFGVAAGLIIVWGITGPIFKFSDTWQLVVNTGTTIVTFLMVFLIQKTQNKDAKAIQLKLNELIAASKRASNRIVDVEDLEEKELDTLHRFYEKLSDEAEQDEDIHQSHSIDNAGKMQDRKNKERQEIRGKDSED